MYKMFITTNFNYVLEKNPLTGGLQLDVDVTVEVLLSTFVLFMFPNGSNS